MGEEIEAVHFNHHDFRRFEARLREETEELERWFSERRFARDRYVAGFELEAWLNDSDFAPAPVNDPFLARVRDPRVVPELARFNVEVNGPARSLRGRALGELHRNLAEIWGRCTEAAADLGAAMLMIGIHPAVDHSSLTLANMTAHHRYRALNEQIMRLRRGRPLVLGIRGREDIRLEHRDLTFEAAATSFQIHLQVPQEQAVRFYNASLILSAPLVAAAANSPYLFGRDLWDETRIPLFEQSVSVSPRRVTLGEGYVEDSLFECFRENLLKHPVLLPEEMEDPLENLHHLRLHNGTIWRWTRPLIGFDEERRPHLRLEQRVVPAGPTLVDSIANAALYYGMVFRLATGEVSPEGLLSFDHARSNLYSAAREGLGASLRWLGGGHRPVRDLILEELLPLAREGLDGLGVDREDSGFYLGVMEERVRSGLNGAAWQRAYIQRHGREFHGMLSAYHRHQQRDVPVHTWEV